ncbi:MAG: hypothetical protein UT86_C0001G0257 [Candidatus Magasanikbacteria bacterium GW2011_GWC2_40_17]|uniref:Uncharacterized protein n=1 Tax=Candidatus Magasanikbacteria bacterium GW2011_GWA2_42_32 TaxID=1619039 RepID=A0A0G1A9C3_9BACT|nr:MAG: hypothetical protein UT86_C0001G0257 [Candidatus Magasanikbacteria bacterium GW2011_GWC2_40_17]KKS57617.1 MAG: hypothetical protein UV20_C0001G0257 [Candidatus Magasanikbacteria bacterium GW2011_GWA2_42_32]OGH85019.1 MAG: hypothetical protein A2294_01845 [Candidatus Magasanikbacteria bacterium RIFOXYB2_FULL_38_10]
MPKYNFRALEGASDQEIEILLGVMDGILSAGEDNSMKIFARECFRLGLDDLEEKIKAMEFLLPFLLTKENRSLFLIAEEILKIRLLTRYGDIREIPHHDILRQIQQAALTTKS